MFTLNEEDTEPLRPSQRDPAGHATDFNHSAKAMIPSGITWSGPSIDDTEIFVGLPASLTQLLLEKNGFIVHSGALHVRGAVLAPSWHSLRDAWRGDATLASLYEQVQPCDVPFAEDLLGDQFLLREGRVIRLEAETGEVEPLAESLEAFFERVEHDIGNFLHLSLSRAIEPGTLLFAWPPFCMKESASGSEIKALPAAEVIHFHADFARQIRSLPDGTKVEYVWKGKEGPDQPARPTRADESGS